MKHRIRAGSKSVAMLHAQEDSIFLLFFKVIFYVAS